MSHLLEEKLREAACVGDLEVLDSLIRQKVDVNSQNRVNGWTALHWAARRGNDHCVQLLLANGADQSVKNHKGESATEVCTYSRIKDLLTFEGQPQSASQAEESLQKAEETLIESSGDYRPSAQGVFVPHYLKNAPLNARVEIHDAAEKLSMQRSSLPLLQSEELVLKVRIHNCPDPDFIEIEIPRWKLTYSALLKICCEELQVNESQVERIRKLPNTRLRKDNDVRRLEDYQELEVVLRGTPMQGSNCYESISINDQRVLY